MDPNTPAADVVAGLYGDTLPAALAEFDRRWNQAGDVRRRALGMPWDPDRTPFDNAAYDAAIEPAVELLHEFTRLWLAYLLDRADVVVSDDVEEMRAGGRRLGALIQGFYDDADFSGEYRARARGTLSFWADFLFRGESDRLREDTSRLAGDMIVGIFQNMVNLVIEHCVLPDTPPDDPARRPVRIQRHQPRDHVPPRTAREDPA